MNGRTNLQITTALLLTKMEVKEESQMKGAVDNLDIIGLIACVQHHILLSCYNFKRFMEEPVKGEPKRFLLYCFPVSGI